MLALSYRWWRNLVVLALALSLVLGWWWQQPALPAPSAIEQRGVWLTNVASGVFYLPWGLPRAIARLADLHFNTLYPVVWNRGLTLHPSAIARQASGRSRMPLIGLLHLGRDPLAEVIRLGHQHGFQVLPWFEYGLMVPRHSSLARQHPEWLTQGRDTSSGKYQDQLERELGRDRLLHLEQA